eukprot:CAMPEP_0206470232 /NCGR_PEP_ID=MMETSP0324_2-20121206/30798_1 /ASSEMBLY_ACC=CAM_ASM_000836 /TAXON_ID=2866 /ORGANISM="Crypthecodinium cohnii, Strain Seligo" /LENGTH=142 /DNA_ID=CAMNT_0053944233 /DNA_START=66 /DNA_END=494 /DNA_ORIENTATION=-
MALNDMTPAQAAFEVLDRDRDGLVGVMDMEMALKVVGHSVKAETLQSLAGSAGGLKVEEIQELIGASGSEVQKQLLPTFFKVAGVEDAGDESAVVTKENLMACLENLGIEASDEEVREMIKEFDLDRTGTLNKADLAALLQC